MKAYTRILQLLLSIALAAPLQAQFVFYPHTDLPVHVNSEPLTNPWTGGLNSAQISAFEIPGSSAFSDLFVFDKAGNRVLVFEGVIEPGGLSYQYKPQYTALFPPLHDWALLRDYDCDGLHDLFTYSSIGGSFAVYHNEGAAANPLFALASSSLQSVYDFGGNSFTTNIYVSSQDLPAIFDFEGDGDLDILTFSVSGSTVELHLNGSVDQGLGCGISSYALANRCYGGFVEGSESASISIDPEMVAEVCSFNVPDPRSSDRGARHVGSSIVTLDANADNVQDLVLGDVAFDRLSFLLNSDPGAEVPHQVVSVSDSFPATLGGSAAIMEQFLAGFYLDVDQDGVRDILVGTNDAYNSSNQQSIYYYHNSGADNAPILTLESSGFLQNETIDLGEASRPCLMDVNADGLLDMVIGARGAYQGLGSYAPTLQLYLAATVNGSLTYQLADADWLGWATGTVGQSPAPCAGDVDADGDTDLLVGIASGEVLWYENVAGAGAELDLVLTGALITASGTLDVGQYAAPALVDLNEDGQGELVIGELNGNLNFYSATSAQWALVEDTLGGVNTTSPTLFAGSSSPAFFKHQGVLYLLVGSENGQLRLFSDVINHLSGDFPEITDLSSLGLATVDLGWKSAPAVGYIDSDSDPDLICGGIGGGVQLLLSSEQPDALQERGAAQRLMLYPNPATESIRVVGMPPEGRHERYTVYSMAGAVVQSGRLSNGELSVRELRSGTYIVAVAGEEAVFRGKLVVLR